MARVVRPVPALHAVVWTLRAARPPRVWRHCPRCDARRAFASSERFRVNAQKRRVDVWLIHRCPDCDFTWNATVVERATPEEIGAARYALFQDNDAATAWACAFAVPGADLAAVPVVVDRPPLVLPARVTLVHRDPVRPRVDRLLAQELGRSRSAIARGLAAGELVAEGDTIVILR
jgi:hypothetical protein